MSSLDFAEMRMIITRVGRSSSADAHALMQMAGSMREIPWAHPQRGRLKPLLWLPVWNESNLHSQPAGVTAGPAAAQIWNGYGSKLQFGAGVV